jgi:hypothetical protein
MTDIARLVLEADSSQLKTAAGDLRGVQNESRSTAKRVGELGKSMTKLGGVLSLSVTAPLALFGKSAFNAAVEAREAFAQVEQALTTMGGASGKTAEELKKSAKQLETFSNFDDDEILGKVTANLLTFGNVSGDVFDRAQQAAVDLSARLGQDLQSSAIQLGKALNDPIAGVTALSRVGVSFTEDQKEMIKAMAEAGDVAGAQAIVLGELEKQFGGAAKAAREAAPGGDQLQAWRTLQEVIGERLVVAFEKIEKVTAPLINSFLDLDENTQTVIVAVAALAAAIGPALVVLGMMATGLSALVTLGPPLVAAFGMIKVAALALMANPVLLAFAAVLAGIYLAWQNWDKIEPIIRRLYEGVKMWLQDKLGPIFDWVGRKVEQVTGFFKNMYVAVVGNSYVPDMVEGIGREFNRLDAMMVNPAKQAAQSVEDAMSSMASRVQALLSRLFPEVAEMRRQADEIALLQEATRMGVISSPVANQALSRIMFGEMKDAIVFIDDNIVPVAQKTKAQTQVIADNFAQMSERIVNSLQGLANSIQRGDFLGILTGVLNTVIQLGGMGAFGKNFQTRVNAAPTNRSMGGPVQAGQPYMVGERGRETFVPGQSGRIVPNNDNQQRVAVTVGIDPANGNITAFVNGQIAATAPMVAAGGAAMAQAQASQAARRSVRR